MGDIMVATRAISDHRAGDCAAPSPRLSRGRREQVVYLSETIEGDCATMRSKILTARGGGNQRRLPASKVGARLGRVWRGARAREPGGELPRAGQSRPPHDVVRYTARPDAGGAAGGGNPSGCGKPR